MYSVNGRRLMHGKAASDVGISVYRKNVAAGVYLLSVKGINGNTFTTSLMYSGGNMNINVAFGVESAPHSKQVGKQAAAGDWTISVSATGYDNYTYTLNPKVGLNDKQNITLTLVTSGGKTFTDERDGTVYKYVTIGEQTWMAENLNYYVSGSVCYENSADSCDKYGRLYNWIEVAVRACPTGWHLPSIDEWTQLVDYVGGGASVLKSVTDWNSDNGAPVGTNEYGFTALPGGYRHSSGNFEYVGEAGCWWSSTPYLNSRVWSTYISYENNSVYITNGHESSYRLSVRCVRD